MSSRDGFMTLEEVCRAFGVPVQVATKRNPWRKGAPPEHVRSFVGFYGPSEVFEIGDWKILGRVFPCVMGKIDALPLETELREPLAWRPA